MSGPGMFLYSRLLLPAALAGYRGFGRFNEKARDFFRIRQGMFEKAAEWDKARENRPAVLVHVASVGELLEAIPLMNAIDALPSPPALVLSHTSASVTKNPPRETRADLVTPSPLDFPGNVSRFLDLIRPSLIIFSSYDLWPNLVIEASRRIIPLALVNARLPAVSGRLKWPGRTFFRDIYKSVTTIGAIDQDSAGRFPLIGVDPARVMVTGNCRFDQTLDRCQKVSSDDPDLTVLPAFDFTFIAGSTWPEDQAHLLPALSVLLKKHPGLGVVIAPHEPGEAHVKEIENFFARAGIETARYLDLKAGRDSGAARVIVVNTVGVLFKLYRRGDAAYVGGSFRQGVHNVMEPAGMGLPVMIGPVHKNSPEAVQMINDGGAVSASDAASMESAIGKWIEDQAAREAAGAAAKKMVENSAGASGRTMELILPLLPGRKK